MYAIYCVCSIKHFIYPSIHSIANQMLHLKSHLLVAGSFALLQACLVPLFYSH